MDRNKELTFDEFLRTDPQYELLKKQQFDAYDLNGMFNVVLFDSLWFPKYNNIIIEAI